MKLATQVSTVKLRGGFYTPEPLVRLCWDRVWQLLGERSPLRVLEPSAGDGAFVRGLAGSPVLERIAVFDAVELLEEEAALTRNELANLALRGEVRHGSFLSQKMADLRGYDVAVGNPPFLRYQFVASEDLSALHEVEEATSTRIGRVANLWIPIFLSSMARLNAGGVFSFVLPSEVLTGVSGRTVRTWLVRNVEELTLELFPPKSYPDVLQEVVIVSGRVTFGMGRIGSVSIVDHAAGQRHRHVSGLDEPTWTALTLEPSAVQAIKAARDSQFALSLGEVARLGVSTVTGANDYFTFDEDTRQRYRLERWARPLLSRTRHAPGLEVTEADWSVALASGAPVWLLDVAEDDASDRGHAGLGRYVSKGEEAELHLRYKTGIREPWYRVPVVRPKALLLSKRSHFFPRLMLNEAGLATTDTVYQGDMTPPFVGLARTLVSGFHNSLTLLTTEIEGRSFGGGVLELVPSEIARLVVFDPRHSPDALSSLDRLARDRGYENQQLIAATNRLLVDTLGREVGELLEAAEIARQDLVQRRLARS